MADQFIVSVVGRLQEALSGGSFYLGYYGLLLKEIQLIQEALNQDGKIGLVEDKLLPNRDKYRVSMSYMVQLFSAAVPAAESFYKSLFRILHNAIKFTVGKCELHTRKTFHSETEGLQKGLQEMTKLLSLNIELKTPQEEIYACWEKDVLHHMASSLHHCLAVCIGDEPLPQTIVESVDFSAVLTRSTKEILDNQFTFLECLANEKFEGRLKIAIYSTQAGAILKSLNESGFKDKIIDILIASTEKLSEETMKELSGLREDVVFSEGYSGHTNFLNFNSILWVGTYLTEALHSNLKNSGISITISPGTDEISMFLSYNKYLRRSEGLRVVVDEGAKADTSVIVSLIRNFSPSPILIKLNHLKELDYHIHEFPFVHVTTDDNEMSSFSLFTGPDLPWAKKGALFWNPATEAYKNKMNGELTIHSISCSNLYTTGRDQFVMFHVNGTKKEKSKTTKDLINPTWNDLNWVCDISSSDSIKLEVFTQELLGTNFEGQTEINLGASYPLPTENFQFTKVLRPQDADPRKAKKVRGCITVTFSFKPKKESADTKHHFGKTLMESLSKSYNDNLLHITDKVIYNFLRFHLEDEGLFRLPGNANRVKYLKMEIENGIDSCWDEELVHDVGSLYKMYFATLSESDTLLPSAMYTEFKGISTISEEDEKIQKSKSIINKLPEANQHVLLSLLSFLNIISQYSAINKMTPKNLAVCFAPTIIIPNNVSSDPAAVLYDSHLVTELLSFIIANVDKMFPKCPYEAFSPPEPPPEVQETEYAQAINLLTKKSYLVNKRSQFSKARSSSAPSITVEGQKVPPPVTTPGGSGPGNPLATSEKKTSTFKEKRKAVMRQSSLSAFAKKTRPRSESAKKPHEANKKNETITEEELPDHLLVVEEEEEKSTMEKEKDKEKEKKSPLKSHASDMLLPVPDSEPGGSQSHRGKKRTSTNTRRRSLRKTLVVKFDPFKPDNEDMFMIDENPKE